METIKNKQEITVCTVDEFISQMYAIMRRDQTKDKNLIFGYQQIPVTNVESKLVTTQTLLITEGKDEVVIELL